MTSKKLLFLIFQNLVFSKDHKRGGWLPEAEAPATSLSSSRSSGAAEDGPTSSASSGSLSAPTSTQGGGFRALEPHSFFADPDPAVLLNADPDTDPAFKKNLSNDETFSGVEKDKKDCSKLKS